MEPLSWTQEQQAMISLQGMAEFLSFICLVCGYICLMNFFLFFLLMHYSGSFNGGC